MVRLMGLNSDFSVDNNEFSLHVQVSSLMLGILGVRALLLFF